MSYEEAFSKPQVILLLARMSHSVSAIRHPRDAYNSRSRAFFDWFVDGTLLGGWPASLFSDANCT